MKFSILGFDQSRLVELKLSLPDAMILRWFVDFQSTGRMCQWSSADLGTFFQVKYKAIIDDLPVLGISTTRGLKKRFDNLVSAGVLDSYTHKKGGTFSCYRIGKEYESLVRKQGSEQNDRGRNKCSQGSEQMFAGGRNKCSEQKNKSTTDESTTDQKETPIVPNQSAGKEPAMETTPLPPSATNTSAVFKSPSERGYDPKTAHTFSEKNSDHECAMILASELIDMASKAYGKKLIGSAATSAGHIIKLFKDGVTAQDCHRTIKWLYMTNVSSEYAFRVESGESLRKKWNKIQLAMDKGSSGGIKCRL